MNIRLLADSCCDTTPELKEALALTHVPLNIHPTPDVSITDDETINIPDLIRRMHASKDPIRTSCPSVGQYADALGDCEAGMIVTLSSRLSGSYNSARLACEMLSSEHPDRQYHVFDSKSAASGELNVALLIDRLRRDESLSFSDIVEKVEAYIAGMRTLFVLQDLSNMVKNGRMSKVKGLVASVMSICPVLSDNGDGEIRMLHPVRGVKKALNRLVECVMELTAQLPERSLQMALSFCDCPDRAEALREDILARCRAISDVIVVPAAGISTVYESDGGIVIAF